MNDRSRVEWHAAPLISNGTLHTFNMQAQLKCWAGGFSLIAIESYVEGLLYHYIVHLFRHWFLDIAPIDDCFFVPSSSEAGESRDGIQVTSRGRTPLTFVAPLWQQVYVVAAICSKSHTVRRRVQQHGPLTYLWSVRGVQGLVPTIFDQSQPLGSLQNQWRCCSSYTCRSN